MDNQEDWVEDSVPAPKAAAMPSSRLKEPLTFNEIKVCLIALARGLVDIQALAQALKRRVKPRLGEVVQPLPIYLAADDRDLLDLLRKFTGAHFKFNCPNCRHALSKIDFDPLTGLQCHWCNYITFPLALLTAVFEDRAADKRSPEEIIEAGLSRQGRRKSTMAFKAPTAPAAPAEPPPASSAAVPAPPTRQKRRQSRRTPDAPAPPLPDNLNDLSVLNLLEMDRQTRTRSLFDQIEEVLQEAGAMKADVNSAGGAVIMKRIRVLRQSLNACEAVENRLEDRWHRKLLSFRERLSNLKQWKKRFSVMVKRLKKLNQDNRELSDELGKAWERERALRQAYEELAARLPNEGIPPPPAP